MKDLPIIAFRNDRCFRGGCCFLDRRSAVTIHLHIVFVFSSFVTRLNIIQVENSQTLFKNNDQYAWYANRIRNSKQNLFGCINIIAFNIISVTSHRLTYPGISQNRNLINYLKFWM